MRHADPEAGCGLLMLAAALLLSLAAALCAGRVLARCEARNVPFSSTVS